MNFEERLQTLQEIKAPEGLKNRITGLVETLPSKHRGFYFPLAAFQMAVVAIVLIVLVGLGSGVVAAAKGSNPGSPLYPIKKAIEKVPFLQSTPTPTPVRPTPTLPTAVPTQAKAHEDEKPMQNKQKPSPTPIEQKDVKGVHTVENPSQKEKGNFLHTNKLRSTVETFFRNMFDHSRTKENTASEREDK